MEIMIGINLGLSIVSLAVAIGALIVAMHSVAKVKGLENSTHQVQFMPVDLPEDKDSPTAKHLAMVEEAPEEYDERHYDDYVKEVRKRKEKWREKIASFYDTEDNDVI